MPHPLMAKVPTHFHFLSRLIWIYTVCKKDELGIYRFVMYVCMYAYLYVCMYVCMTDVPYIIIYLSHLPTAF